MKEAYLVAKSLPEVKFVWVGDGPERSELIDKIRQDNIKNILLVDFCDDPTPYLAAANIYLTTSRWEGLPLSILESMSLGVPIVASDVVGHREVVGINCTGILYSLGKSEKAVEAIKKLLENDDINLFIKNSAFLVHSSFYSTKIMGERILEVYQKAL